MYPVTIDPLSHSPEWVTSSNGLLPALLTNAQLQIDALYGFKVTGLGDVNGDGFDDVAIGAPAAIDIIGPSTIVGAGAVFIYFGSPAGLSDTPDKVLRSTTPVANALFGFSIAGGNVTGNTRNDIIIGAPGESYTAAVSGFPATATVTAGKVYVFRGEDMSTAAPAPFLSIFLNGSTYFSRGLIGLVGSNIATNALFGFSVAATEDMKGDGLGEVIVGAPGYAELALVPVSSGAALVYYSGNLATNTPVKLIASGNLLSNVLNGLQLKAGTVNVCQKNCTVQLNWTATQDDMLKGYVIDHSVNGVDYRLAMLDKQGSKSYSSVLSAMVSCSNTDITVNPNPFADKVIVYFSAEKAEMVTMNLYNEAGSIIVTNQVSAKAGSNQFRLTDLGSLPSGVYIIQVKTSIRVLTQRLLK